MEKLKFPTLARFLILKDAVPYGWHRIKYFLGNSLFKVLAFWLDLLLIFPLLPFHFFAQAFFLKIGLNTLDRFWWGALEVMREEMRQQHCMRMVFGWMVLSSILSTLLIASAGIWLFLNGMTLFTSYVSVLVIAHALAIVVRTFHSGAYALARIRRPLWSLCAPTFLFLSTAYISSPFLHEMCWPFAMLLSTIVGTLLSCYFIEKQYRFLSLLPIKKISFSVPFKKLIDKHFWLGGLSFGLMNLNPLAVNAILFSLLSSLLTKHPFTLLLFPIVHLGFEWTSLYYFDLKKTAFSPFLYEKRVFLLALGTAIIFTTALGSVVFVLAYFINVLKFYPIIVSLLFWQTFLSIKEIRLYTAKNYTRILMCNLMVGIGALFYFWQMIPITIFMLCLSIVIAYYNFKRQSFPEVLGFFDALQAASLIRKECRLGRILLSKATPPKKQRLIAQSLCALLEKRGFVTCFGSSTILWFEYKSDDPLTRAKVCCLGGGLIEKVLLESWKKEGKGILAEHFEIAKDLPSTEEICSLFQKKVPASQGSLLDHAMSYKVARQAWLFLHFLRAQRSPQKMEIVALYHPFENKELFFALSSVHTSQEARQWKRQIVEWNKQLYLKKALGVI